MRNAFVHMPRNDMIDETRRQCRRDPQDFAVHVARGRVQWVRENLAMTAGVRGHDDDVGSLFTQCTRFALHRWRNRCNPQSERVGQDGGLQRALGHDADHPDLQFGGLEHH